MGSPFFTLDDGEAQRCGGSRRDRPCDRSENGATSDHLRRQGGRRDDVPTVQEREVIARDDPPVGERARSGVRQRDERWVS